ncbi:MAG TPA: hypothetical protein VMX58_08080, partial [Patescibacteria group bacterium]|nr:hypothetical protein [Patescibacteria group bacterium]
KYKNIIWTYSSSQDALRKVIQFTPESDVGEAGDIVVNYLSLFLAKGGHLWTLGRSEQGGGLAAIFKPSAIPLWPATFKFDMATDADDTSAVDCMGHRDYCVTMLDKIWGSFRTDPEEIPANYNRNLDRDGMRYAVRADNDPITQQYPGLPERLELWDEVARQGRFFDPQVRGFIYCEIYDPSYYMEYRLVESQPCFHPMYRMRARSSLSFIDNGTIAIWVDKYSDIVPEVKIGVRVAARSFHFGFPLWFFNRSQVDAIVNLVFSEWQILDNP